MGVGYDGFDLGFNVLVVIAIIMFVIIIGVFIVLCLKRICTWRKNNNSPRLSVTAKVVSKRMDVSNHSHANAGDVSGAHGYYNNSVTSYYVTFQFESGDRMEFFVPSTEYGILVEEDEGKLSFQGTRYLSFERF